MSKDDKTGKSLFWLTILAVVLLVIGLVLYVLDPHTVIQFNVIEQLTTSLGVFNAN